MATAEGCFLATPDDLAALFGVLDELGYRTLGPTVRDGVIVIGELSSVSDLPVGITDEQAPGRYGLKAGTEGAWFGFAVGPQSARAHLSPPDRQLLEIRRRGSSLEFVESDHPPPKTALFGIRPCDLAAMEVQDRVLADGAHPDPHYVQAREATLVIVANCGVPAETCFCTSTRTGPRARSGFDLSVTEVIDGSDHYFVLEAGSETGRGIVDRLGPRPAERAEINAALAATESAAESMTRSLPDQLNGRLLAAAGHARWDDVASRCLSCGNCTMVCPTCFCSTMEDMTDLSGETAHRVQVWDSCFSLDHSYIHGGSVRSDTRSRYRQWLTHKLDTWWDQFGRSGCVGCGRCITWCPPGIDLTVEAAEIVGGD